MVSITDCPKSTIENIMKNYMQCIVSTRDRIILRNSNFNNMLTFAYVRKRNSAAWRAMWLPSQKKICQAKSTGKVLLIFFFFFFFFDKQGIIYQHVVPSASHGQRSTINSKYYCEVLKTLFTHIIKKDRNWRRNSSTTTITYVHILPVRLRFSQSTESRSWSIPLTVLTLPHTIFDSFCTWNPHFGDRDLTPMKQLLQCQIFNSILSI